MKNRLYILSLAALMITLAGCNKSSNIATEDTNTPSPQTNTTLQSVTASATNAWARTKEMSSDTWQNVRQGSTNAWQNVRDGSIVAWQNAKASFSDAMGESYDKKNDFVAKAQSDLDALDQKIQQFTNQAAAVAGNAKTDAQAKVQELRDKRGSLNQKLTDVKNSTADTWDKTKTAFNNAYDDVKSSLTHAWQWVKDQTS